MAPTVSAGESRLWSLELAAPHDQVEAVACVFENADRPQALAVSWMASDHSRECRVCVLYDHKPPAAQITALLKPLGGTLPYRLRRVPETDWVRKSQEDLTPIRAGRFFVTTKTHRARTPPGALPLVFEAGQAFATGHHATTLGCLLALTQVAKKLNRPRTLDLGCGSGVLGIAAAKLWRHQVVIGDLDPIAVKTAQENARRNGVGPLITAITATGVRHARLAAAAPFDLVMVNILARPLAMLAPSLSPLLAPCGRLILSGLLSTQEAWVRTAYGHHGLTLRHRIILGEWSTLVLVR